MAEVTVEQLAKTVGTDPDKLLSQMKDAGLPHKKADEGVSDDDKRDFVMQLGAKGVINRKDFDCWGQLPEVGSEDFNAWMG